MNSLEQSFEALSIANRVRAEKVAIKERIGGLGRDAALEAAARIAEAPDGPAAALSVAHLVRAVPRMGEMAVVTACRRAGIMSADRKLRDLTGRQRRALAETLRGRSLHRADEEQAA